ncbi:MAG: peptide MFS transporter [Parachlamydiales bacterium]|nr:peptide MFS transporter [Parachlamydiales bacterium]
MFSKHPKELWILSLTELCERFVFWGVGNLLVLYLIEYYQYANENATHIYAIFSGCATFLPFLGGFVADRWNYQAPLLIGAIVNALGCFLLAMGIHSLLFIALTIIALGYGIFTPSLVTVLNYSYREKPELREAGFSIYYASINIGVFLALLSLGSIGELLGWNLAFLIAGFVQVAGLIPLIYYLIKHKETYRGLHEHRKSGLKEPLTAHEKNRIFVIGIFCLVSIFFWAAYNQAFSSMEVFAHSFMDKTLFGKVIPSGVFLSSESFFLILLAPFLAALYTKLHKKNLDPSPATKTSLSLFFLGACFLVMVLATLKIPAKATTANVSWNYLVFAYFLMAVGEMLLAPIGLSAMTRLAPKRFTALSVGIWYLCVGLAFYTGGMLAGLMQKMGGLSNFFSLFVFITVIPGLILFFYSRKLTRMSGSQ